MSQTNVVLLSVLIGVGLGFFVLVQRFLPAQDMNDREHTVQPQTVVEPADPRTAVRAFYTAPPVITHEVASEDSGDCLECHLQVTRLEDGRIAMQTPHPQLSSCLQCHVPSLPGGNVEVANAWKGLEEPRRGDRWFWTSPPTVPHRLFMRENCLSCHGPENPDMRLRTTHPERTSCLQCHVPNTQNEI